MLLEHLGLHEEAGAIDKAVQKSLELGITTEDLNFEKPFSTSKVGDFIADYVDNQEDTDINFQNIHMGQSTII